MTRYNPSEIEPKWQHIWADDKRYEVSVDNTKRKYYVSGMFPYPSAAGMHVGHTFEHAIVDAVARFQRAQGANVLNPMGWDAFGLPAENYAIKTGTPPAKSTAENIAGFTNQLKRLGASIDWSREINTSSPEYYKWTQWIFTQLFERGLAYQKEANQWWCPQDMTVLANEQVENGKCWRCGSEVEKKAMKQWFFKITDYADALLDEIPALDWPEKIKTAQTNWIGRSEGAEIDFKIVRSSDSSSETASRPSSVEHPSASDGAADVSDVDSDSLLTVFTTRPDTIFGVTFMVIAPEHPLISSLVTDDTKAEVEHYVAEALKKSEIDRMSEGKEKTGVFTGGYAVNPATGEQIPIWVADYVLWGYGTGAIMAVPAHDERDREFAHKYDLEIRQVVAHYYLDYGSRAPRGDKETLHKHTADTIITDGQGNYLVQTENDDNVHFVGGGVDDDDASVEAAARREVLEEVGYPTIISMEPAAPQSVSEYYRHTKDKNMRSLNTYFVAVVDKSEQVRSEIDDGKHSIDWVHEDEVAAKLTWDSHKAAWNDYLARTLVDYDVREGVLINSGAFDGVPTSDAREEVVAWLEQQGVGRSKVTYKMRDWLVSRQRYWGAPIPVIHCETDGAVAVPESDLPVLLPEVEDFEPKGESVLASVTDWVETTCPKCGGPAKRETDTMDGYACSSWYLLRYTDPHNSKQAWSTEKADYWTPLDMYVGGDHAVAHLLYVRFWNHVFYDMGLVPSKEPVKKLVYHGLIGAEDGRKMSKSLGNVIDPLEIIDQGYGADALRTFELFLGPINENSQWSSRGIAGVYRFLNRAWTLVQEYTESEQRSASSQTASRRESDGASAPVDSRAADVVRKKRDVAPQLLSLEHRTIKKVTTDIYRLSFNTAIAGLMEYVNELYKLKTDGYDDQWQQPLETLVQLLAVFAPHMSAELWQQLTGSDQLDFADWPTWDESLTVADTITIAVQVNGKLRGEVVVASGADRDTIEQAARSNEKVAQHLAGEPKKVIVVAGKLVNFVV